MIDFSLSIVEGKVYTMGMPESRIGTCSWKYPSWSGLVYSGKTGINYLKEYVQKYDTVEIDQWFWSLFQGDKAVLPNPLTVKEYAASVPQGFLFTVKAPNSITLTHYYQKRKDAQLEPNPHLFSIPLLTEFLDRLAALRPNIGMIIFQFEYLNRKKMASLQEFLKKADEFFSALPRHWRYGLEMRNENYFKKEYFEFINKHSLNHVFIQGYYMPPITEVYSRYREYIRGTTVIRLHGSGREKIEEETGSEWNKIVEPKDRELDGIIDMVNDLLKRDVNVFVNVNNHYEGSAPLTIEKIRKLLGTG